MPINMRGWIAVVISTAIAVPSGYFFVTTPDGLAKWTAGLLAFLAGATLTGLAFWHREVR